MHIYKKEPRLKVFPVRVKKDSFVNYSYVILDEDSLQAVVIDPAWEPDKINAVLTAANATLAGILLTHSHFDHVDLVGFFTAAWHCPVWMSAAEINYYRFHCEGLIAFEDGALLSPGGIPVQAWVTPGHTAGSTCFYVGNCLFSGDTLFIEGCGLCWGKGANPYSMFDSLQRIRTNVTKEVLVFPGHSFGLPVGLSFEEVMLNNIYLNFKEKDMFVAYRMRNDQQRLYAFQ
ncbi:MBL fold metallo-hydrolase [Chitinophaga nivalis]|uniref:MBL fold metallo-hydrolase n=1 Tax=Chitinophaga nivalis TaxID=2991709 RepID=A0ABT3IIU9_9BACT|nr:MBL fold metallo-hydrolase [Chitinophaga nivalis]MCW3466419.1 MBL fold metallo-hydrolase [Chitinophaga nivalis]MCW3483890.1 MBL fold metallo-hydrolase [Chitinophaga nivalis]